MTIYARSTMGRPAKLDSVLSIARRLLITPDWCVVFVTVVLGSIVGTWEPVLAAPRHDVPLPPQIPQELRASPPEAHPTLPPTPAVSPAPTQPQAGPTPPHAPAPPTPPPPAASADEAAACAALLASGMVKGTLLPAISETGGCGIAVPIKLSSIVLASKAEVSLEPPPTVRCAMASAVADWIRVDLAPLLAGRNGGIAKLTGVGGYQCRGRNRVVGAKMSEHAVGNAIDVSAFVLKDSTAAKITDVAHDPALFAQVKLTTCARFSTVLGPGSDGYHDDNLHLDIEARRNGRHLCHWQLP